MAASPAGTEQSGYPSACDMEFGGILAARRFATLLDGALREQAVHRATGGSMSSSLSSPLLRPGLCLLVLTLGLACAELARQLPGALWWQALLQPQDWFRTGGEHEAGGTLIPALTLNP